MAPDDEAIRLTPDPFDLAPDRSQRAQDGNWMGVEYFEAGPTRTDEVPETDDDADDTIPAKLNAQNRTSDSAVSAQTQQEHLILSFAPFLDLSGGIVATVAPTGLHPKLMDVDSTSDDRLLGYSIIIPAYNESERVGATLEKVLAHVSQRGWEAEIIAVDDGSQDNTAEIIRGYAEKHPGLRLLQNPGNRGNGYSVRNGMLHARGKVLLFTDADLSSPMEEADNLFAAIAGGADIAIGSRWLRRDLQTQRQPLHRQIFGRIFNLIVRITLGLSFKDTQCGFKAFTRPAARAIFSLQQIERWGFDPELLFLARKLGFKVAEVPVEFGHSEGTRISPLRDGARMFGELLRIRWNGLSGRYNTAKQ
jgi:dolichyl-phosphate beta-glucosyltransferase